MPIIVVITDMPTPKQEIAVAEAGPDAQAAMKIAAAETAEYFIVDSDRCTGALQVANARTVPRRFGHLFRAI